MAVTIISYPDNQINESFTTNATDESSELIKYVWVNVADATTDTYIEVIYNGITKTYYIEDECIFEPIDIFFLNKEGAQQSLTFFKERDDDISVKSNEYESDTGQPSLGFHQYKRYNIQGRETIKMNSGFVEESNNETFTQLFLSERIWVLEDIIMTPINLKSISLEYKTQQKDKLINYEVSFEYAYNKINNI